MVDCSVKKTPGVQIITQGGGDGVTSVDLLLESGRLYLAVPDEKSLDRIQEVVGSIIEIMSNPIDMGPLADLPKIMLALDGDISIGLTWVMYKKIFNLAGIPTNISDAGEPRFPDAIMTLTSPDFSPL